MSTPTNYLNQVVWIGVAVVVGIGAAVTGVDGGIQNVDLSQAGLAGLAYTALRVGLMFYRDQSFSNLARKVL